MRTTLIDTYQLHGERQKIADGISLALSHETGRERQGYVISVRTTGWGDCLLSMIGAWYHACVSDKTLIIDWRRSLYLSDPEQNAYSSFFQVDKTIAGIPVLGDDQLSSIPDIGALYSKVWAPISSSESSGHYREHVFFNDLARNQLAEDYGPSTAIYPDCLPWAIDYKLLARHVLKHVHPKTSIENKINQFSQLRFSEKMIGIHLRFGNGGNIMNHAKFWQDEKQAIQRVRRAIDIAMEKYGSDCGLFICTDTAEIERSLRRYFPQCLVRQKAFRSDGVGELHHMMLDSTVDGSTLELMAEDALIDMYLLAKCDAIVRFPPDSYFSFFASAFKRYRLEFPDDTLMPAIEF